MNKIGDVMGKLTVAEAEQLRKEGKIQVLLAAVNVTLVDI